MSAPLPDWLAPASFSDRAAALLANGIPVFPCNAQKQPLTANGFKNATTDAATVEAWSNSWPDALIGVPTGPASGVDVLDVDFEVDEHGEVIKDGFKSLNGHELPATRTHTTRRGGKHFLFKTCGIKTKAGLLPGVDTRGDGGYIVWWPADGGEATVDPVADAPDWLRELSQQSAGKPAQQSGVKVTYEKGGRNAALTSVAGTLRNVGMDADAIDAALQLHNAASCVPPLPENEVTRIARSVSRYEPTDTPPDLEGKFPAIEPTPWPELREIPKSLSAVLPFDYDMLPKQLVPWVKDTAERKCWAPDYLAVSFMVVAATLIGRKVALQPYADDPSWRIVPNLWGIGIGTPGAGKTPASDTAMDFMDPLITRASDYFDYAMKIYEGEVEFHNAQVKALEAKRLSLLKGDKDTRPDEQAARAVHAEIQLLKERFNLRKPVAKRYKTGNATPEALFDILKDNPQGVCFYPDEFSKVLKQMGQENFATLRGLMLTAANGNSTETSDRRTDKNFGLTAHLCLSMFGSIQPGMLPAFMGASRDGGEGDDGLPQRFGLTIWPDPVPADPNAARAPNKAAHDKVTEIVTRLDAITMQDAKDQMAIPFDRAAESSFNVWRCQLLNNIERGICDPALATYVAKYPKVLGGLALIIALVEGNTDCVPMAAWEKARKWEAYLLSHLKRAHGYATLRMDDHARNIIAKLRDSKPKEQGSIVQETDDGTLYTTPRELQRIGLPGCGSAKAATDLLDWIEELGYVAAAPKGAIKGARVAFLINPALRQG